MNEKRKRDEDSNDTEDIIQAALREQQEAKKAKKQVGLDDNEAVDKGKTLGDIEQEEGGTIKESEVAMAHAKRTQKRKARKGTREGTCPEQPTLLTFINPLARLPPRQEGVMQTYILPHATYRSCLRGIVSFMGLFCLQTPSW